jgi:hypothetical protein
MSKESKHKISHIIKVPAFLGLVIGFFAAFVQALIISAGEPEAYGFCVACHIRDLVNALFNAFTGETLGLAPISAATPVLTIIGVIIGGYIAATKNKEFKIKKSKPFIYLLYFLGGIAVLNFALLLGACPYRAALRFSYGDLVALIGILSIAGGVAVGVLILLFTMKRRGVY